MTTSLPRNDYSPIQILLKTDTQWIPMIVSLWMIVGLFQFQAHFRYYLDVLTLRGLHKLLP